MISYFIGTISLIVILVLFFITEKVVSPRLNKEYTRKFAHVAGGLFAIAMAAVLERNSFIVLAGISTLVMVLSYQKNLFTFIHGVNRPTIGEVLFPLGILAAYIIASSFHVFYVSVLILTISDTLGGLTTQFVRNIHWPGSIVFFFSSLLVLLFFYDFAITLIIIAIIITVVEKISIRGTDNLTIPSVSALILSSML